MLWRPQIGTKGGSLSILGILPALLVVLVLTGILPTNLEANRRAIPRNQMNRAKLPQPDRRQAKDLRAADCLIDRACWASRHKRRPFSDNAPGISIIIIVLVDALVRLSERTWDEKRHLPASQQQTPAEASVEETQRSLTEVDEKTVAECLNKAAQELAENAFRKAVAEYRHPESFPSTATGIRTPVSGMRSQRPSPLDDSGRDWQF